MKKAGSGRRCVAAIAALACCVCAAAASAQQAPDRDADSSPTADAREAPRFDETILVIAERGAQPRDTIPAATALLTREDIERLPADNLAELLDALPGFQVSAAERFGGLPIVSARGFYGGGEAEYVQLRIDGVPVGDVESGLADWQSVGSYAVERIEVLRGPGSSLYGDTAMGGVVEVTTRRGDDRPGRLSVSGGSFGSFGGDASLRRSLGSFELGVRGGAFRSDGFRDHSARRQGELGLAVERATGSGRLVLDLAASVRDRDDPGPLTAEEWEADPSRSNASFRFDREERRKGRAALSYLQTGRRHALRATLHGSLRDSDLLRTLLLAPGLPDRTFRTIGADALGLSFDAERRHSLLGAPSELRAGVDLARESLDSDYFRVSPGGEPGEPTTRASATRQRIGAFASHSWNPTARLRVTAGVRWDRIEDERGAGEPQVREAWSPRGGVNLRLGPLEKNPISLYAQVSRSFKTATLDQLFDPRPFPDFAGGTIEISNPALEPQRAVNVELGASQDGAGYRWQLLGYWMDVSDEIDFDVATFAYRNIGESRHSGVELDARFFDDRVVSPGIAYAWMRVRPQGPSGGAAQLKNIPEHVLRGSLSLRLPAGIRGELRYSLTAGRYLDDDNLLPLPSSSIFDVRLEKRFQRLRARLDLLNLTDDRTVEYGFALADFTGGNVAYHLPGPGFAVRASLGLEL